MIEKIIHFMRGYVEIIVRSHFIERFINICVHRNIYIWDVFKKSPNEANMKMSIKAFKSITPIAHKTHSKVRIRHRFGLPFLVSRYKKRYFFAAGLIIAALFISASSQFVWSITIVGNETVPDEQIIQALSESGFKKGCIAKRFDPKQLKNEVLLRLDTLSWVWVDIRGSKAIVSVSEKKPAPEMIDEDSPCDIIASKSGIIKSVIAKQGDCIAKEGQTVMEGELLISGIMKSEMLPVRFTHASGEVYARTWYEEQMLSPLVENIHVPTGQQCTKNTLDLFGLKINLFIKNAPPYEVYDKKEEVHSFLIFGIDTNISLTKTIYQEVTVESNTLTEQQIIEKCEPALEEKILSRVDKEAVFEARDIRCVYTDEENVNVILTIEYTEQIGFEKPINLSADDM